MPLPFYTLTLTLKAILGSLGVCLGWGLVVIGSMAFVAAWIDHR